MAFQDEVERLAREGGDEAVVAFVRARADEGDADALLRLGEWLLWGHRVDRDLEQGYACIARAAAGGDLRATIAQSALIMTGTGTERDIEGAKRLLRAIAPRAALAQQQLDIAAAIPTGPPRIEVLSADPYVARVEGLISPLACGYVAARAAPSLQPSFVIDPVTAERVPSPIRTSLGTNFAPIDEDLVLHMVNCRAAEASGTEVTHGEPLQILHYSPGQRYREHLDALPGVSNQRSHSVLIYLNDGYGGGETVFPALGLRARGRQGDALVFANLGADGRADPRTEHAGAPVTAGEKWLATRWIRQRPTHCWKPETLA